MCLTWFCWLGTVLCPTAYQWFPLELQALTGKGNRICNMVFCSSSWNSVPLLHSRVLAMLAWNELAQSTHASCGTWKLHTTSTSLGLTLPLCGFGNSDGDRKEHCPSVSPVSAPLALTSEWLCFQDSKLSQKCGPSPYNVTKNGKKWKRRINYCIWTLIYYYSRVLYVNFGKSICLVGRFSNLLLFDLIICLPEFITIKILFSW